VAINLVCPCGQELLTDDTAAGRKVRCPQCQGILLVPNPHGAFQPVSPTTATPSPYAPKQAASGRLPTPPPLPRPPASGSGQYPAPPRPQVPDEPILEPDLEEEGVAPGPPPSFARGTSSPLTTGSFTPPPMMPPRPGDYDQPVMDDDYDEEAEEEYRRKKKKIKKMKVKRQQFKLVNLGLMFYYFKVIIIIAAIFLTIFSAVGAGAMASQGAAGVAAFVGFVGVLVSIALLAISPMLGITGGILCCFAPPKSNTRPLILVSVSLDGMGLLIGIVATVALAFAQNEQSFVMKNGIDLLTFVMGLGSFILFMLFLKKLALYLNDEGTASEAHDVMMGYILGFLGPIICIVLFALVAASLLIPLICAGGISMVIGFFYWVFYMIKLLIRYLNLLNGVRQLLINRGA
jgi:hypothetical protein